MKEETECKILRGDMISDDFNNHPTPKKQTV